jgi:hypothetical protein
MQDGSPAEGPALVSYRSFQASIILTKGLSSRPVEPTHALLGHSFILAGRGYRPVTALPCLELIFAKAEPAQS